MEENLKEFPASNLKSNLKQLISLKLTVPAAADGSDGSVSQFSLLFK